MNKETLEAASRVIGIFLDELAVPGELTAALRRAVDRVLDELGQITAPTLPPGPTIAEELHAESARAAVNISGIATLAMRMGAPYEQVRDAIRGHLLQQAGHEQHLIHTLLTLPRRAQKHDGGLH